MAETLGRFGKVPAAVSWECGDITVYEVFIHLADGIALLLYPLGEFLSRTQKTLDTTRGIAFVVQGGGEGIQVRSQRTPPQPGNHAGSYKGVLKHVLLLFLKGCLEKEKDRTS
jgi:hypothetical protein